MATAPPAPTAPGDSATGGGSPSSAVVGHAPTVGLAQGAALYIAAVLGTGILVLPALAAQAAGPGSLLAVIALIGLSIPLAGTFAALAARFPDAGGVATFVRLALGPTAARMAGYWFFFGVTVGAPVVGLLGAEYVVAVLGIERWVALVLAPVLLVPPFISNLFGLRFSGKAQLVLSGLLVVIVVGVVAVAAPASQASNFSPLLPHGWAGVGLAVSLFVWAFAGWEAVTHIAGEFTRPRRTIPLATAIAIVVVGACYLGLQFVTVGVLGDRAGSSPVPLLDLVAETAPAWGKYVVATIAAIVALGVVNTYVAALANLGASLGRDGHLPRWFAKGAEAGGVPRRALALVALLVAVYFAAFVVTGGVLTPFILIHTSSMVSVYALGVVAALRLLPRFGVGWWFAAISTVLVAGLILLAGANLLVPLVLAVAAVLVTLVQRVRATRPAR